MLAHARGLDKIVKGVETAAQALQLQPLGCDHGQECYFGRPLPADGAQLLLY